MKKTIEQIEWEDEIVMCLYYQELLPVAEIIKHIETRQLIENFIGEAQDNG